MKYKHSAFLLKNSPLLQERLKQLGYEVGNKNYLNEKYLAIDDGCFFGISERYTPSESRGYIYCGEDEDLFMAIAGIREYFYVGRYYWYKGSLAKCTDGTYLANTNQEILLHLETDDGELVDRRLDTLREATIDEVITFFKNRRR